MRPVAASSTTDDAMTGAEAGPVTVKLAVVTVAGSMRKPDGSAYRLVPVELPVPQLNELDTRLPASYVNFLIVNRSVFVPVFGCPQDAAALNALQHCFPGRKIVPVPGGNLIRQFGGPHCATMQLPVNTLKSP